MNQETLNQLVEALGLPPRVRSFVLRYDFETRVPTLQCTCIIDDSQADEIGLTLKEGEIVWKD